MECASTLAQIMIERLLSVHALACMGRANGRAEHFETALRWMPKIEEAARDLRRELEKQIKSKS